MAIYYVDDLYPRTAPKAGARIRRFSMLQLAEYFHQRNGTGAGKIALRADEADAGDIDPRGLQYVRKRRVNDAVVDGATLSGFSEKVVGGFFLEEGDFLAIDTKQQRLLSFGGAGTLAYLDRAQMASHTYVYDIFTGMDPFDGTWRLWNQSTIYAGGDFLGAILWRIVYEAQHFRVGTTPYTHRHRDGTEHTDIHHDDRLVSAIPDIEMTFTGSVDSSGNPWTVESGEFIAQVGESVLDVTKRLMEAGLYVELDPDTFELNAWEIANHGRDRTGLAWGANVVRFEPPADQNQANGNILNDLKRAIRAIIRRTWLLAGSSNDQYGDAHAGGDVKWEGFYPSEVGVKSALEAVAARQIQARNDAGDTVRVRIHVANDPSNGSYLPGEHVQVDDTVILHTGTDPWDWNEAAYPVAQWSIKTRRAGDTDAFVDLGSVYFSTADRQFQAPGGPGKHTHPPNPELCRPGVAGGTAILRVANVAGGSQTPANNPIYPIEAAHSNRALLTAIVFTANSSADADLVEAQWRPVSISDVGNAQVMTKIAEHGAGTAYRMQLWRLLNPNPSESAVSCVRWTLPNVFRQVNVAWYLSDVDQANPNGTVATNAATSTATSLAISGSGFPLNFGGYATPGSGPGSYAPTAGGGQTSDGTGYFGGATNHAVAGGGHGSANPTWTLADSRAWKAIGVAVNGSGAEAGATPNDGHPELVGTGNRAARCGHKHHVLRTRAPDVNDDWANGMYPTGTLWIWVDDTQTPTEIIGTWVLLDASTGAAVWEPFVGGGGLSESEVNALIAAGLADHVAAADPHSQYYTKTDGTDNVRTVADAGATHTIENPTRNRQDLTLTQDCAITMPSAVNGKGFVAFLRENGTGGHIPTLTDVEWPGGETPAWDTAANALNIVPLTSDGVSWYGVLIGAAPTSEATGGFVPTLIAPGETFTVPANRQALFAMLIDNQGTLVVDGYLIEVD